MARELEDIENWHRQKRIISLGEDGMEEKIKRIREIVKEIDSYNDLLFMYEGDRIDLQMLKDELWEILRTL